MLRSRAHSIYVSPIARIMFVICFVYMYYVRAFRSLVSFASCYFRARCAYNLCAKDLLCVEAGKILFRLLRNCLPEHTLPRTYDLELYSRAILYSKGLTTCWSSQYARRADCLKYYV
ncbi:hypothetical protein F4604DRAFT_1801648 [Suillus subluteus]|nr:hypothetical protein F4604DRAFT_1821115 [Suillus subluteus]KAG1854552.1 hypothetical protein F4604DRAFT_1801648 [Suillus subluteus]